MRLELPDEAWAELYEPAKVPERKRRPAMRALVAFMADRSALAGLEALDVDNLTEDQKAGLAEVGLDAGMLGRADELNDALVLCFVRDWNFGEVNLEVLGEIPGDAYRALAKAVSPHLGELMPDFSVSPDPKAITGPSSTSSTAPA